MNKAKKANRIWINAGEVSGDLHGALLVKALRRRASNVRCLGMGGSAMAEAGFQEEFNISELSLLGLFEVLAHLPRVLGLMRRLYLRLKEERPDAVVLIDSPDFNFFVARMARRLGIPVYYYICPQVWAWRTGRVEFLKRFVRRVLCILPFEKPFLAAHGLDADFVGHPLMDQIPLDELDAVPRIKGRVGILPGSRTREIESLLPEFVAAARRIKARLPEASFALVRAPGVSEAKLAPYLPDDLEVEILPPEDRYRFMRQCEVILAASGTVTLETALLGTPTVVAYKISPLSYRIGRALVKVEFMSLPNLILGEEAFPELLQEEVSGEAIAHKALAWLTDEAAMAAVHSRLERLAGLVGEPGAPDRAVGIILDDLETLTALN
ncbi:MAG: lipid-A-disaccharide synthase [Proteobacteria bacterium]|nr:lipid-A-disaccharide synthase [Pseudomonadota bacterium]